MRRRGATENWLVLLEGSKGKCFSPEYSTLGMHGGFHGPGTVGVIRVTCG